MPRQLILEASAARPRLEVDAGQRGGACRGCSPRRRGAGFDLASEPPLRAHLFALGEQRACAAAAAAPHCRRRLVAGAAVRAILRRAYAARCRGKRAGAAGAAGAICRLHAVAARGAGQRGAIRTARLRASWRSGPARSRIFPIRSSCRPTGRGLRSPAIAATAFALHIWRRSCTAALLALARDGQASLFMVLQAGACGAAHAAGRGHRHPDRQPDCGAHRQRARRSGRLLRQHPGAAHRHVGQSELPRADCPGARQPILPPTAIRTCRSSGWSRCSTRRARWRAIRCSR